MNGRIFISLSFVCLFLASAQAQTVPALVNYQGRLANPDGTALATGDYQLTFRVYDSATNGGGLVWGPQVFDGVASQGHGGKIPVVQGYFNVMLGPADTNGVSLADAFNASNRFVEIRVGTNGPILPRQQVLSAAYALNAAKLAGADWSAVFGTNDPVNGKIPTSKLGTNGAIVAQQVAIYGGSISNPPLQAEVSGSQNFVARFAVNRPTGLGNGNGLALRNIDPTPNNITGIHAENAAALSVAGIEFVNVNHEGLGSRRGALSLFTLNSNTTSRVYMTPEGRVGIGTLTPSSTLQVIGTVTATEFNPPSDRNLKENFTEVSISEVLEKVVALPISRWNFKDHIATPHLGPMAQDFHAAFGLGTDERHIATVDADGVALAAIQGLNQKLEEKLKEKDAEIALLKQRLNRLEKKSERD